MHRDIHIYTGSRRQQDSAQGLLHTIVVLRAELVQAWQSNQINGLLWPGFHATKVPAPFLKHSSRKIA